MTSSRNLDSAFLGAVGVIEVLVGVAVLAAWARLVAMAWLLGLSVNLVLTGRPAA